MNNPFSISFGKIPLENIERPAMVQEVVDAFNAEPINQQIAMVTGVRGSGKTVLMTDISRRLGEEDQWIIVELNPETDMLLGLASRLSSIREYAEIFRKARINLSFWGLGVEISGEPPITNIESAITRMLESLKKKNKRVLVAVDEVTSNENVRVFAAAFQIFVRQELPIFLIMTGLYENIYELQNEKSLTFLYRAPKISMRPLNLTAMANRYAEVFSLEEEQAREMARMTKGYPFAFQVLGFLTWRAEGKYESVENEFQQYLEEFVYDKIWMELSNGDKKLAYGIASSNDGEAAEIRNFAGIDTRTYSVYRNRLLQKGIVESSEYGKLRFTLPLFGKTVLQKYDAELM